MSVDSERYHMRDALGNDIEFTEQQKKCIDYDSKTALVIKGTAGSGKSMMVIKRAIEYVRAQGGHPGKNVVIFTYNKALATGIREILSKNGVNLSSDSLSVFNIDQYLAMICRRFNLIPRSDSSGMYGRGYKKGGKYNSSGGEYQQVTDDERELIVAGILEELSFEDPHPYYRIDPAFWAEEIQWMFQNGLVDDDDENVYLGMSREGRCKNYAVHLSSEGRRRAFRIFNAYNRALMNKKKMEWDRIYAILYRDYRDRIGSSMKFDYLLIDEAQDMTLTKMRILKDLCKDELCVAMDKNQSLYGHRWSFLRDLGIRPHVKTLEVNHRGTMQIDLLSQDLKRFDDSLLEDEDIYQNEVSPRSGPKPRVVRCKSPNSEMEFVVELARKLDSENRNTAILCPNYKSLRMYQSKIGPLVASAQFFRDDDFSSLSPGIKFITIHSSKGLGFTNVIIPNFENGVFPRSPEAVINSIRNHKDPEGGGVDAEEAIREEAANSRRLAYVGITRALVRLIITYSGEPSQFISEFDPDHYDLVDESSKPTTDPRIGAVGRQGPRPVIDSTVGAQGLDPSVIREVTATESSVQPAPVSTEIVSDPVAFLKSRFEVIDKRPSMGALWVIDGPGVSDAMKQLNKNGLKFDYAKNGSRSTGHRPAYYMKE